MAKRYKMRLLRPSQVFPNAKKGAVVETEDGPTYVHLCRTGIAESLEPRPKANKGKKGRKAEPDDDDDDDDRQHAAIRPPRRAAKTTGRPRKPAGS